MYVRTGERTNLSTDDDKRAKQLQTATKGPDQRPTHPPTCCVSFITARLAVVKTKLESSMPSPASANVKRHTSTENRSGRTHKFNDHHNRQGHNARTQPKSVHACHPIRTADQRNHLHACANTQATPASAIQGGGGAAATAAARHSLTH